MQKVVKTTFEIISVWQLDVLPDYAFHSARWEVTNLTDHWRLFETRLVQTGHSLRFGVVSSQTRTFWYYKCMVWTNKWIFSRYIDNDHLFWEIVYLTSKIWIFNKQNNIRIFYLWRIVTYTGVTSSLTTWWVYLSTNYNEMIQLLSEHFELEVAYLKHYLRLVIYRPMAFE